MTLPRIAPILLVLLAACGGRPTEPPKPPTPAPSTGRTPPGATPPASDPLPSLDALAARGPTVAPLMREALRAPDAKAKPEVKPDRDTCLRAAIAATGPVKAFFADAKGAARGDAFEGTDGTVPPSGPACVKRGDVVRLVVEGEAAARAVVFAAP